MDALSNGTDWWTVAGSLGAVATFAAALVAAVVGLLALKQRSLADRRAQWWERAQWALDASFAPAPERRTLGLAVLTVLAESSLATEEELEILDTAWQKPAADPAQPSLRVPEEAPQVEIAAAKLRIVLDRRLHRETPFWVEDLSRRHSS